LMWKGENKNDSTSRNSCGQISELRFTSYGEITREDDVWRTNKTKIYKLLHVMKWHVFLPEEAHVKKPILT
jgi:hypothetical protein